MLNRKLQDRLSLIEVVTLLVFFCATAAFFLIEKDVKTQKCEEYSGLKMDYSPLEKGFKH